MDNNVPHLPKSTRSSRPSPRLPNANLLGETSSASLNAHDHESSTAAPAVELSIADSWAIGIENQQSIKLILPDMQYRPYYLPESKLEKKIKSKLQEERASNRELYLCMKESATSRSKRSAYKQPTKPRLCPGDQVVENRIMEQYKTDAAKESLIQRAKWIEEKWKSEEIQKRQLMKHERERVMQLLSAKPDLSHADKVQVMSQKKEASHQDRLLHIMAVMDMKNSQYQKEIETKHMIHTHRDLQKMKRWIRIIKVLNFALICRGKIDFIRLQKKLMGPKYKAVITLQSWFRDLLAVRNKRLEVAQACSDGSPTARDRRRSTKVTWKSGFENLKSLLVDTQQKALVELRGHACAVITSFVRSVARCFRGYVHKFLLKVVHLQRLIRKHQQRNNERVNLLLLAFECGVLPIQTHIRIVASGKSFASKNLTEVEYAAISRMTSKYIDNNSRQYVKDMRQPEFHQILATMFPLEVHLHSRHMKMRAEYHTKYINSNSNYNNNPDFPLWIKRRVCMDYFYQRRRYTIRKRIEDRYRVVIAPVSVQEVKAYIHSSSVNDPNDDPLARNINQMLAFQDNIRTSQEQKKVAKSWSTCTHVKLLTAFTPQVFAQLYFQCNEKFIEYIRSLTVQSRTSNEEDDEGGDDEEDIELDAGEEGVSSSAIDVESRSRKSSRSNIVNADATPLLTAAAVDMLNRGDDDSIGANQIAAGNVANTAAQTSSKRISGKRGIAAKLSGKALSTASSLSSDEEEPNGSRPAASIAPRAPSGPPTAAASAANPRRFTLMSAAHAVVATNRIGILPTGKQPINPKSSQTTKTIESASKGYSKIV